MRATFLLQFDKKREKDLIIFIFVVVTFHFLFIRCSVSSSVVAICNRDRLNKNHTFLIFVGFWCFDPTQSVQTKYYGTGIRWQMGTTSAINNKTDENEESEKKRHIHTATTHESERLLLLLLLRWIMHIRNSCNLNSRLKLKRFSDFLTLGFD